jgi:hypothetical protein
MLQDGRPLDCDLETVPDLAAAARVIGIDPQDEATTREALRSNFSDALALPASAR